MTMKKRGRPVGIKNKKKPAVLTFEKQLEAWDKAEKKVDYKGLVEKLQPALAKAYVEIDAKDARIDLLEREVRARDVIINYLERRQG